MPISFVDSNVILYLASEDAVKAERAEAIIRAGGTISVQVLNEVSNVARRKMGMSWPEIRTFASTLRELLSVHPITLEIHEAGLAFAERYHWSVFDAMIASSAVHAGCDTLWSEDMQHGMRVGDRLRILNPFRGAV